MQHRWWYDAAENNQVRNFAYLEEQQKHSSLDITAIMSEGA